MTNRLNLRSLLDGYYYSLTLNFIGWSSILSFHYFQFDSGYHEGTIDNIYSVPVVKIHFRIQGLVIIPKDVDSLRVKTRLEENEIWTFES